ncbi:LysR family transcriptional regulator [Streptantibioticus rubrisoli]|uniref:LysR substrate-binding domain-containing protein n=1 Tax=Streptantibioticus rubrisoli TaxID=1387313 RepID=A0ABT1PAX1_9ACTN|nr:LysR substrate-binding domain-containing protein [Streptantibioticus rubrisoli]MCQ4041460.1 LysR substrate-binding domain-containing protein [Streptantibioticus rubrisoli]
MSDGVELRELRYFRAVAEELNFTRAAERLGIAQPPLSRTIRAMERRLGVRLLDRSSHGTELTAAGAVLLEQARLVLTAADAAVQRTVRAGRVEPRLVIAAQPSGHGGLLQRLVDQYHSSGVWPSAEVALGGWGAPTAMLREGRADVALLRDPFDPQGLDFEVVATEPRVAVLPHTHRLIAAKLLCRQDLAGEPVPRWRSEGHREAAYRAAVDHLPPEHPLPPGPEVNNLMELLEMVALGQGVAFLSESTAAQHRRADLVHVPVSDISPSRIYVAWPQGSRSPAVAAFVRCCLQEEEWPTD